MSQRPDSAPSDPKSPRKVRPTDAHVDKSQEPGDKSDANADKPTSRRRRIISWVLLGLLALIPLAEFRARTAYEKHLKICQDALERNEGKTSETATAVTFNDLKDKFPTQPVHTSGIHSFAPSEIYTWKWRGIRSYKLQLFANPSDGRIWELHSEP